MTEHPVASDPDDWDRHWTTYAESAEENPAQDYRRHLIAKHLEVVDHPATQILDIGSGSGDLVDDLHQRYPHPRYLGLELSASGVAIAQGKVPDARFAQYDLLGDVEPPDDLRGWATHAVCSEVLEHVDEPEKLLFRARAFLRPGGRLVVTVPGGPRSAFDQHIGHRRHYTVKDMRRLVDAAGLEVVEVTGAGFPFFNMYRLVVVARGARLIDDVAATPSGQPASFLARAVMRAFSLLFRLNLDRSPFGYQIVAVAREPLCPR